jgi:hypothetical protein
VLVASSIETFHRRADAWFDELRAHDSKVVRDDPPLVLEEWEARWFNRGFEARLFGVEALRCRRGTWASRFTGDPFRSRTTRRLRDAHFVESVDKADGRRRFNRESITALAAITRLVDEFGHPAASVLAQSDKGEVDGVVFDRDATDPDARIILGVEAKVHPIEHQALVWGLQRCGGVGDESTHIAAARAHRVRLRRETARNHHKKCCWIAWSRPATFWIVSPGRPDADVFGVAFDGRGSFRLTVLPDEVPLGRASVEARAGQANQSASESIWFD